MKAPGRKGAHAHYWRHTEKEWKKFAHAHARATNAHKPNQDFLVHLIMFWTLPVWYFLGPDPHGFWFIYSKILLNPHMTQRAYWTNYWRSCNFVYELIVVLFMRLVYEFMTYLFCFREGEAAWRRRIYSIGQVWCISTASFLTNSLWLWKDFNQQVIIIIHISKCNRNNCCWLTFQPFGIVCVCGWATHVMPVAQSKCGDY